VCVCVYVWSGAGPLGVGVAPPCMFSLVSSPPPHWFRSQRGVSRVWSFWTVFYVQASDNRYTHTLPATIITCYLQVSYRNPHKALLRRKKSKLVWNLLIHSCQRNSLPSFLPSFLPSTRRAVYAI